jgi:uncharacterized protein YjbI with pentapeptide repeats
MTFPGNTTISGNFTVVNDLTVSGGARFVGNITGEANLIIEQTGLIENIVTSGTISGTSGVYTNLSGASITGDLISGTSGVYSYVSGTNVTGNTISGTSGVFTNLSGATITGDLISGTSGVYTNLSGASITGALISGTSGVFTALSGASITGNLISGTSGVYGYVSGTSITGNLVSGTSGVFTNLSGTTITGNTIQATSGVFVNGVFVNGTFDTINISGMTTSTGIFASGTESTPSITFIDDLDTGIYSPAANELAISTSGTGRLFIDDSGNVGIGTSSPDYPLDVFSSNASAITTKLAEGADRKFQLVAANGPSTNAAGVEVSRFGIYYEGNDWNSYLQFIRANGATVGSIAFVTSRQEAMRIDANGNVGIGTNNPGELLHIANAGDAVIRLQNNGTGGLNNAFITKIDSDDSLKIQSSGGTTATPITFAVKSTSEAARIDSNGRLLVGTSTTLGSIAGFGTNEQQIINNAAIGGYVNVGTSNNSFGPLSLFAKSRGGTTTIVQNDDNLGEIRFAGADGTDLNTTGAAIQAIVDGTPGVDDLPTRLVFSTTADGASTPTERMRISNDGQTYIVGAGTSLSLSNTAVAGTTVALIAGRHSATAGTPGSGALSFVVTTLTAQSPTLN